MAPTLCAPTARRASPVAFVLVATFAVLAGLVFMTQGRAHAFQGTLLPPAVLPAAAVGAGIVAGGSGAGIGVVAGYGGSAAAATATATTVAVAPVAVAAGAVVIAGAAVYIAWKWSQDRNAAADAVYDPSASPTAPGQTVGCPAGLVCSVTSTGASFTGTDSPVSYASWGGCFSVSSCSQTGLNLPSTRTWMSTFGAVPLSGFLTDGVVCFAYWGVIPAGYPCGPGSAGSAAAGGGAPAGAPGSTPVTTRPTSQCSNGQTVQGDPVTFTGSTAPGSLPPLLLPACPPGTTRTAASFPTTFPGGSTAPSPLAPWAAPTIPSGFPECQGAGVSCVLTLTATAPDGSVRNCTNTGACTGWHTTATPERVTTSTGPGTQVQTLPDGSTRRVVPRTLPDGSTLTCRWGIYVLPANECTTVPTETAPPPGTESSGQDCLAQAVTLGNPASWVLGPVKCALRWAFVPSAGKMQGAQAQASAGWQATGLPAWGSALGGVGDGVASIGSSAAGCGGPQFSFTLKGRSYAFAPLNACSQPMAGAAVVFKLFASLAVLVAGARMCARPLLASFGMGSAV